MGYHLKRFEATWFLMQGSEFVESFDSSEEANLALFDKTRRWTSLWDVENE